MNNGQNEIYKKLEDTIKELYHDAISKIDKNGKTPLMRALDNNQDDLAMYLILKGESLGEIDKDGKSTFEYILDNGNTRLLKAFLGSKIGDNTPPSYDYVMQPKISEANPQSQFEANIGGIDNTKFAIDLGTNNNIATVNRFVENNSTINEKTISTLIDTGLPVNNIEKDFTIRYNAKDKKDIAKEKKEIFSIVNTLIHSNPDVASKVISKNIDGIDVLQKGSVYKIIIRDKTTRKACLRYECRKI